MQNLVHLTKKGAQWHSRIRDFLKLSITSILQKNIRFRDVILRRRRDASTEEKFSEFLTTIPWFVPSICVNIVRILWRVITDRFGLITEFSEHLQIVTTSNYSVIANSHTQQFITARTQSAVFTSRSLVTAFNTVDPSTSCSRPYWPVTVSQLTEI
jgi:hypothetical protein